MIKIQVINTSKKKNTMMCVYIFSISQKSTVPVASYNTNNVEVEVEEAGSNIVVCGALLSSTKRFYYRSYNQFKCNGNDNDNANRVKE